MIILRNTIRTTCLICLAGILCLSCEKVVSYNLNESASKLVIEGNITNETGPYFVRLSQSTNHSEPNVFPPVTGATVTISDNAGNQETLVEQGQGIYKTSALVGTAGRTYQLTVSVGGKQYTASSTMPLPVSIDTLIQQKSTSIGSDDQIAVLARFRDPAGIRSYYRLAIIINGRTLPSIFTFEDIVHDGVVIDYELKEDDELDDENPDDDINVINPGDNAEVILYCIDKEVHTYFLTLSQNSGGGPPTAPGNPVTNIKGDALGYFSAHTVARKNISIK